MTVVYIKQGTLIARFLIGELEVFGTHLFVSSHPGGLEAVEVILLLTSSTRPVRKMTRFEYKANEREKESMHC